MQVAPEKELFQKFAPSFAEQSSGFLFIAARSRTYVLMSIIGVAMVLRLYGIAAYTLAGDEYGSIIEAKWLGLNQSGSSVGEVRIQNRSGAVNKFPLRMDRETTCWAGQCAPTEPCKTVFQWHKRITMVGQNSFPDAWRDFQAGMHAVVLNLPGRTEIDKVSVRYAGAGHLFVLGIALRS